MHRGLRVLQRILAIAFSLEPITAARAAGTAPLFDLSSHGRAPFPSDRFSVPDPEQLTGRRIAVPLPDCSKMPADCDELAVINELDGFNLQPRLSIPFTGPIDPASATSKSVFLLGLGDVVDGRGAG